MPVRDTFRALSASVGMGQTALVSYGDIDKLRWARPSDRGQISLARVLPCGGRGTPTSRGQRDPRWGRCAAPPTTQRSWRGASAWAGTGAACPKCDTVPLIIRVACSHSTEKPPCEGL
jgi:hypothetical protein